jgi:ribonucleotide reductase alpha subunit
MSNQIDEMYVLKRDGHKEIVSFDKILQRIKKLGKEANIHLNYTALVMKVIDQIFDGISTSKIDELSAEQCASMASINPDYNTLAGRIAVSNLHKNTSASFFDVVSKLYEYCDKSGKHSPIVSADFYTNVLENREFLEQMCDYSRDYLIDYFGMKTLERAYLMKTDKVIVERPQHMWLRVAVGIHGRNLEKIAETYYYMSNKYMTHATPTLFNAGTAKSQMSSCFLVAMEEDSLEGIYDTLKDCARISKWSGGIGLHIHNVRAKGSQIRGTNGTSTGIVPMLRVFNNTAKYIDQGSKRNGSFAIYLEPWHADIEVFLQMRKNHGDEELKARDLFYALWIPDLFMERVKTGQNWTLMCPDECPGLSDVWGNEFKKLYEKYELEGKGKSSMLARYLWFQVLDAQMETGTPYLLYKDACNRKSNQQNVGTIKSSNLCVAPETLVLTDKGHIEIQDLIGQKTNVWNGSEFSEVEIVKTGENQELMQIYFSNGKHLWCTPYHKFYIYNNQHETILVDAQELKLNMQIIDITSMPNGHIRETYTNVKVVEIMRSDRKDDTYCFTEPKRNAGIFNGILTSQCSEIIQYSDKNETAVCNLASIALPAFIQYKDNIPYFNFDQLHKVASILTYNLNRIIDINFYPTEKTRTSNFRHRPIGLGVQGLADVFMMMNLPFTSPEARILNRHIFETIYHGALEQSCELAKIYEPYDTFEGSPASRGILQFDMWNVNPDVGRYDWTALKSDIMKNGLRNSLLVAPMPTASTSQILGYNECIEPITSNIYSRRTLAGEFIIANKYMVRDLIALGQWNDKMKNNIIANNGSIQHIETLPKDIREKYRTVWEMPMRSIIDMAADRGAYVCQSQSLNLWIEDPNYNTLTAMHFYSWTKGLKTGIYYLRRRGRHQAQQFTIEPEKGGKNVELVQSDEVCENCSA